MAGPSYATLKRRLPGYAKDQWRRKIPAACAAHAGLGPASLIEPERDNSDVDPGGQQVHGRWVPQAVLSHDGHQQQGRRVANWAVLLSDEVQGWLAKLAAGDQETARLVRPAIRVLSDDGPTLGSAAR